MKKFLLLSLALSLFTVACKDKADPVDPMYSVGKNRFTVNIDGVQREYFVHVPAGYNDNSATPLVFMLHGTGGDGEKMYDISGWKELGETENLLTVFPSSGRYCIIDDGETKNTTKWNTTPDTEWIFCAGQTPLDDIKFLRAVIAEVSAKFNIDSKRIYLNGFSNGGQMAAKCSVEMSDVLAAVCENAGSFFIDTVYIPKRKLPVLFQIGDRDYGPGNEGPEVPLSYLDTLISTPGLSYTNGRHYRIALAHLRNFNLNPNFSISGDTSKAVVATYLPASGTGYEFRFVLVEHLAHIYPNGSNHWMNNAEVHWEWMQKFKLP